jgi:hypothetical protein
MEGGSMLTFAASTYDLSVKGVDLEEVADFLQMEILHRYPGVYEVVTDRGGESGAKLTMLCKAWGINTRSVAKSSKFGTLTKTRH